MFKIIVKKKAEIIKEYIIDKDKITIGRIEENNIVLDDKAISEEHCVIKISNGNLVLEDLNTSFGTTVNGEPISRSEIKVGDEIGLGGYLLCIRIVDSKEGEQKQTYLLGIQGKLDGHKFELNSDETRIGRSEEFNDIWISKDIDKTVSRRHVTINYIDGKYVLTDKRSRNRTFINQKQINETDEVTLENNDEILIGKSIFRFIIGGKENYSLPAKAGIFWVRFFPKLKKIILIMLLLGGMFLIAEGVNKLIIIEERPDEVYLIDTPWRPEGFIYSKRDYLSEEVYDITPSPAIGDINGDGNCEIIMADAEGRVYAWDGGNGSLLWTKRLGHTMLTSPVLADINDDDILDIVIGAGDSRVYVLDGVSGELLYRSSFIGGKILFASSPLVTDLDGDGLNDIVVVTDDRIVCFLYSPAIGQEEPFYFRTPEDIMSSPVLLRNIYGNNRVAVATSGGKVYFFDATNPESKEVLDITQRINMLRGINLVLNEISSIPAVADLDGDGIDDMVLATSAYYIVAISGRDDLILWTYAIEPFSVLAPPLRYSSPVITDLNGDGIGDVIVGWANGKIIALDGRTGESLWEYSTGEENRIISSIALADFNKDKIMDILIGGEDGRIFLLNGAGYEEKRTFSDKRWEIIKPGITSTASIGDVNGDGIMDVVLTAVDGSISVYTTQTRVFKNDIFWNSFRKDADNRGSLHYVSRREKFEVMSGIGVFLLFGVPLVFLRKRKKRIKKRPQIIKLK